VIGCEEGWRDRRRALASSQATDLNEDVRKRMGEGETGKGGDVDGVQKAAGPEAI